jgi:hypothetical protein
VGKSARGSINPRSPRHHEVARSRQVLTRGRRSRTQPHLPILKVWRSYVRLRRCRPRTTRRAGRNPTASRGVSPGSSRATGSRRSLSKSMPSCAFSQRDASVQQLANIVLKDYSLTLKVIRAANSFQYNRSGSRRRGGRCASGDCRRHARRRHPCRAPKRGHAAGFPDAHPRPPHARRDGTCTLSTARGVNQTTGDRLQTLSGLRPDSACSLQSAACSPIRFS